VNFSHVDVFTGSAYGGNSLTVFFDAGGLAADERLAITREMRHFESIFLEPTGAPDVWEARVVALDGELAFAGHPLLGAAAVLHDRAPPDDTEEARWTFLLPHRRVAVCTRSEPGGVRAKLQLDAPALGGLLPRPQLGPMLRSFGLDAGDRHPRLAPQVVDVGLRYLVLPLADGLDRASIRVPDLTEKLEAVGAELAYLLQVDDLRGALSLEARHWTNDGKFEDVATGSGAAAAAAYLGTHGFLKSGHWHFLRQGRFAGRPSTIEIAATLTGQRVDSVSVAGSVVAIGNGVLLALPDLPNTPGTRR
jgi:trans-2,3-dihydro-3-hydroxyanthranilate isomerase